MWEWVKDEKLAREFSELTIVEKMILFIWALLPIIAVDQESVAFLTPSLFLSNFSLSIESFRNALSIITATIFIYRWPLVKAAFSPPVYLPKELLKTSARYFIMFMGALGIATFYLYYRYPEIEATMKMLTKNAKILDWVISGVDEEIENRFIFYYFLLGYFGRGGSFVFSVVFFAFIHDYSAPYIMQMFFASTLYLFLMLWSGSLSLPILVHLMANSFVFLRFKMPF